MLKATVSGSFHRHMVPIYEAVGSLREAGVDVLSPSDPRVVDYIDDFLFVASDMLRSIKLVQSRHLQAIRASNFLWVVSPDGYTGASTSMEIGAAYACGVPVFTTGAVADITLREYVTRVPDLGSAIEATKSLTGDKLKTSHLLIDPAFATETMHAAVDHAHPYLIGAKGDRRGDAEREIAGLTRTLRTTLIGLG